MMTKTRNPFDRLSLRYPYAEVAKIKMEFELCGMLPVKMTFVSEEIMDGVRITRGTTPSGTPFVLEKRVSE